MERDIILALISFVLGILSVIATQVISRRLRVKDARHSRRIQQIEDLRAWMEAYLALFQCKYPTVPELVFAHRDLVGPDSGPFASDRTARQRVYEALREFQEADAKYHEAERTALAALNALGDDGGRWYRPLWILRRTFLRRQVSDFYHIAVGRHLHLPKGLVGAIAPHLEDLYKRRRALFKEFPEKFLWSIAWDKLDYVEASEVLSLIHTRLPKYPALPVDFSSEEILISMEEHWMINRELALEEARLHEALDAASRHRGGAEESIECVLRELEKYKVKWLPPA